MSEEIKTDVEEVSTQPESTTEKVEVTAPKTEESVPNTDETLQKALQTAEELAKALTEKDAELSKEKTNSENYKNMGLKWKNIAKAGGIDVEEQEKVDIESIVAQKVQEALGVKKVEEESAIEKANRTIEELKRSIASKSSINNVSSTTSNKEEVVVEKSNVSAQEIADIKQMFPHWTDTQIKKYAESKKESGI